MTTADETLLTRPASRDVGLAFKGLMGAVRRLRAREAHGDCGGLSDAQYRLLQGLLDSQAMSSGELAALADLAPATTTEMLETLEADGLVARERSARDRRVVLTSLTERGLGLLTARHAVFAPRWEAALERFSDAELRNAAAVLEALRAVFEDA
jgi:DNA-binding MarR family transcriptional regulator